VSPREVGDLPAADGEGCTGYGHADKVAQYPLLTAAALNWLVSWLVSCSIRLPVRVEVEVG
jgi:hypothetical protein